MRLRKQAVIPLFFFLFIVNEAWPANTGTHRLFLEGGAYLPSPGYTAQDNMGGSSLLSPVYAIVGPRGALPFSSRLDLEPGLRLVLPWRKNADGNQKFITSIFNFDLGYSVNPRWKVRAGLGFQWTWITGSRQALVQQNGTSSTTFYTPDVSESVWQGGLDLGASYLLGSKLRATLDITLWEFASSARRRTAVLLGLDYALF